ncbi:hypothetical protein [Streptomyces sp. NPDC004050]
MSAASSYASGVCEVPLLGDTIGENLDRTVRRLTDLIRCAACNRAAPMMSSSYTCMSTQGGSTCLAPASVYAPAVERYVVGRWLDRLTSADPEDPILVVVADRWGALTKPAETAEIEEARAALKAAEAQMERLLRDRRKGLYEGPAARFFEPAWQDVNRDMEAARKTLKATGGVTVDISFLMEPEMALEAWEAADTGMRRDLLRLAIDGLTVAKAKTTHDRARFDGDRRVKIRWATVEEV